MGQAMGGGGDEPAGDGILASLRGRYEDGTEELSVIAAAAGMTGQALALHARRAGWKLRKPARKRQAGTRETIARLKSLLQQRLSELEAQIGTLSEEATAATSERDIRAMNTLVRTLEKVLELERKERTQRARQRKARRDFDDAERDALAEKLEGLRRELQQQEDEAPDADPADPGSAASQP